MTTRTLSWYTHHGTASPKTGKIKPFIAPARRPKGVEHQAVTPGVFYRTPLYADSHLAVEGSVALCGRELLVDERWWVDSGWEEALGAYYLIVDERKTGHCGPCGTDYKALEVAGHLPQPKPRSPSPFLPGPDTAMAKARAKVIQMQLDSLVARIVRAFPGSEAVDE